MRVVDAPAAPVELTVVVAFDYDGKGHLLPAFQPREMPNQARAIQHAKDLAIIHDGVIAWTREAQPDIGDYGEPTELFRHGDVPNLD